MLIAQPTAIDHASIGMNGCARPVGVACAIPATDAASMPSTANTAPNQMPPSMSATRYSCAISSAMPQIAKAEPTRKPRVMAWPKKIRPMIALGTKTSEKMTATRPEVSHSSA